MKEIHAITHRAEVRGGREFACREEANIAKEQTSLLLARDSREGAASPELRKGAGRERAAAPIPAKGDALSERAGSPSVLNKGPSAGAERPDAGQWTMIPLKLTEVHATRHV